MTKSFWFWLVLLKLRKKRDYITINIKPLRFGIETALP